MIAPLGTSVIEDCNVQVITQRIDLHTITSWLDDPLVFVTPNLVPRRPVWGRDFAAPWYQNEAACSRVWLTTTLVVGMDQQMIGHLHLWIQ